MIPKQILKEVRRIEIMAKGLVNEVFSGEYHSAFKGLGMEFAEVREYQYGDDIRSIDWNVSARTGKPYIKIFEEERELTVMLIVDASASGFFGTYEKFKNKIAAELCSILAFSATRNNDKVGLIIFTDKIEKFIPPNKGKIHVLRVVRELLAFEPTSQKTDISQALDYFNRVMKKHCTAFLVSDFQTTVNFEKQLRVANKKHDLIALSLRDPRETKIPAVGIIELVDAETGEILTVDTSDKKFRKMVFAASKEHDEFLQVLFSRNKVDLIDIFTEKPYIEPLAKFFKEREKRNSR
ncbi:DUF58 domain-containing protein [bacterium]|nr:DUF58 domain-containing protein [bacterium]